MSWSQVSTYVSVHEGVLGFGRVLGRTVRPNSSAELFGRHGRTAEHLILTKIVNMDHFCEIRYVYNSLRDIHFCVIRFLCKVRKQFPKGRCTLGVGQPTPIGSKNDINSVRYKSGAAYIQGRLVLYFSYFCCG